MTKKEHFENFTKCWICHNTYFDGGVNIIVITLENIEVLQIETVI